MTNLDSAGVSSWTCSRCEMTVSFAPEVKRPRLPETWTKEEGELFCLACRRDIAGEEGLESVAEDAPNQTRLQVRSQARIEFEIKRDPDRQDNRIAKACGTSTVAVRKARANLGLEPQDPA